MCAFPIQLWSWDAKDIVFLVLLQITGEVWSMWERSQLPGLPPVFRTSSHSASHHPSTLYSSTNTLPLSALHFEDFISTFDSFAGCAICGKCLGPPSEEGGVGGVSSVDTFPALWLPKWSRLCIQHLHYLSLQSTKWFPCCRGKL